MDLGQGCHPTYCILYMGFLRVHWIWQLDSPEQGSKRAQDREHSFLQPKIRSSTPPPLQCAFGVEVTLQGHKYQGMVRMVVYAYNASTLGD